MYNETVHELNIYNKLKKSPDFREYILPLKEGRVNQRKVTLEFNYVHGGDLLTFVNEFIQDVGGTRNITASNASIFFKLFADIARALKFLYKNGLAHGDIKQDNIYIANGNKALLFDFGQAIKKESRFDEATGKDMFRYIFQICDDILIKSFRLNKRYTTNLTSKLEAVADREDQYETAAEYWDNLYEEYKPHASSKPVHMRRRVNSDYRNDSNNNHLAITIL